MSDDQPAVEPIALAFTRPPMLLGVRYEIFALNGMVTVILFIMTSNFLSVLVALQSILSPPISASAIRIFSMSWKCS